MQKKNHINHLNKIRHKIDKIDNAILVYLSKRFELTSNLAKIKLTLKLPVQQKNRWNQVMKDRQKVANQLNLPLDFVKKIFKKIQKESILQQKKVIKKIKTNEVKSRSKKSNSVVKKIRGTKND